MSEFEHTIAEFIGSARESLRVLEQGQRDQGQRIGKLEEQLHAHLEQQKNGAGWKQRGLQAGSLVAVIELFRHLAEAFR